MVAQALGEKVGALLKVVGHRWGRSGPCPSPRGALPVVAGLPPRTAGCRGGAGAVAEEGMQQGIPLRLGCCEPGPARGQQEQKQRQKQEEAEEGGGEGPPGRPPSSNRDGGGGGRPQPVAEECPVEGGVRVHCRRSPDWPGGSHEEEECQGQEVAVKGPARLPPALPPDVLGPPEGPAGGQNWGVLEAAGPPS